MVQTANASRHFHLIDAEPAGDDERRVLRVPDGQSRLVVDGDDPPRLLPDDTGAAGATVIEPIMRHREMMLLIVAPQGRRVRVNGSTVGRLTAARETDVIQVGAGGRCLHVAVHVHTVKGQAPESRVDEQCVICHRPLGTSQVYICCVCGHAVHCDTGDGEDKYNCMLSENCPSCQAAVHTDGYTSLPEDLLS